MAMSGDTLMQQALRLDSKVKKLINNDLRLICKDEGLLSSGVKAVLQSRIMDRLRDYAKAGDSTQLELLRYRIENDPPAQFQPKIASSIDGPVYSSPTADPYRTMSNASRQASVRSSNTSLPPHKSLARVTFTESPFFSGQEPLTQLLEMPVMSANRYTAALTLALSHSVIEQIRNDKSLRLLLYCCVDQGPIAYRADIAFPNHIEIKVNGDAYQGNLRGIKKKPGTTRPADLTDLIRKTPQYQNQIAITYANTDKKHVAIVNLVRKHSVEDLVKQISSRPVISKQTVIREMLNKARDPDIITTSSVMSLKCPLSTMRMVLPCRSTMCSHNQCFDATSFLQTQEQAPQWACPTCAKVFKFENLVVDQYVQDILKSVSSSVDQVTVEPDGSWKAGNTIDDFQKPQVSLKRKAPESWDHDDFIEISDTRINGFKGNAAGTPQSNHLLTPTASSREASAAATSASHSNKRPASEIIDLTLSSDEDEDPIRPPVKKRQSFGEILGSSSRNSAYQPQSSLLQSTSLQDPYSFMGPSSAQAPSHPPYNYDGHRW